MPRSVLVTGSSSGIGEACVLRLAADGWRVFAGVRDLTVGEALARRAGERVQPVVLDVTDADGISAARATVESALAGAPLSGLVNNAGIAVGAPLELLAPEDLRHQLEVNVVGQVAVTQAFLPLLRRAGGRIVFMGSIAGRSSMPVMGAYAASKHALEAVADAFRVELRRWHIAVSLVEPGVISTAIWDRSVRAALGRLERIPPEAAALYETAIGAARRRAEGGTVTGLPPDRVAEVVVHALTSARPRARYLVGRDARLRLLLERILPTRLRDRLIASRLEKL